MNKRNAVAFGNNYPGTSYELSGCVNDALDWSELASERGYTTEVLVNQAATRDAMLAAIEDLVAKTGWGDRGLIFNSGHGTYKPDLSGDEPDRRDEAICPHDFATSGVIIDDDLYDLFSKKRYGARIVMFTDTCYAGTATRSLVDDVLPVNRQPLVKPRYVPPAAYLKGEHLELAKRAERATVAPQGRPTVPLMAAAAPTEYSWDATFLVDGQRRSNGAFSYYAIKALRANPNLTYTGWIKAIRTGAGVGLPGLPSGDYPQTPQYDQTTLSSRYWKALG